MILSYIIVAMLAFALLAQLLLGFAWRRTKLSYWKITALCSADLLLFLALNVIYVHYLATQYGVPIATPLFGAIALAVALIALQAIIVLIQTIYFKIKNQQKR